MKNPLELTLLEIEALMVGDREAPHNDYTRLLMYARNRQIEMQNYEVQKVVEQIRRKEPVSRREAISLDADLLDACEVITLDSTA